MARAAPRLRRRGHRGARASLFRNSSKTRGAPFPVTGRAEHRAPERPDALEVSTAALTTVENFLPAPELRECDGLRGVAPLGAERPGDFPELGRVCLVGAVRAETERVSRFVLE